MAVKTAKAKAPKAESVASIFATAQVVKAGAKKAADNRAVIETEGLLDYASVVVFSKALEPIADTLKANINEQQLEQFVKAGVAAKKRPGNYRGVEGAASASLELRKRSDRSPLTEIQVEYVTGKGVDVETVTEYTLNKDVLTPEIMALIDKALSGVKGIPPNLFSVKSRVVATDNALDQAFQHDVDTAKEILACVGVLAIKPKLEESFSDTVGRVAALLDAEVSREGETVQ